MRKLLALAAMLAAAVFVVPASQAITDGVPDQNGHPYVGLMVAQDSSGTPLWRCSGTLLSSTVFLTAGHCVEAPAAHVEIWFDSGYPTQIPRGTWAGGPCGSTAGYPCNGDAEGTPVPVPGYRFPTRDLGLVTGLTGSVPTGTYGQLPTAGQLDALKTRRGVKDTTFTAVGYGLQKSFPDAASWKTVALRTRMVAYPKLIQINVPGFTGDFSLLLSNNASTGGTCFGDSGGPNFLGNSTTVAGVTSFGINGNCAGTGGVFRLDKQDLIDWIDGYLP